MQPFQKCPQCSQIWQDRADFLVDISVSLKEFKADLKNSINGTFVFQHDLNGCAATLTLGINHFIGLDPGPVFPQLAHLTAQCEGHCEASSDLSRCSANCSNANVRDVIQLILAIHSKALRKSAAKAALAGMSF